MNKRYLARLAERAQMIAGAGLVCLGYFLRMVWSWGARHRTLFLFGGAGLAVYLSWISDPDGGMRTFTDWADITKGVLAVALAFWALKALHDYIEADRRLLFAKARETSTGAGLALIALAIVFFGLLLVFAPRAHAGELPPGFYQYGPGLKAEQKRLWPDHPDPVALAALVEQETCPSLKSKSCWSPLAKLKSAREEGGGFCQMTRAYGADGRERFDAVAELAAAHSGELRGLSWANLYGRPDLQERACVLKSKDSTAPFRLAPAALQFGDAALNGGIGGTQKERRACAMTKGCDPGQWFGHVERHCLKSHDPLYGGRSACDINREHVANVFGPRRAHYVDAWGRL